MCARLSACVFFNACTETCCIAINGRHSSLFIYCSASRPVWIDTLSLYRLMGCTLSSNSYWICFQLQHLCMCVFHARLQHNLGTKQWDIMRDSCLLYVFLADTKQDFSQVPRWRNNRSRFFAILFRMCF